MRIFQFIPPKYKSWEKKVPEIYYYGQQEDLIVPINNESVLRLATNYERLTNFLGRPDIIFATHAPTLCLLCSKAVDKMKGNKRPVIFSWLHGPPRIFGGGNFLPLAVEHLAISESIRKEIENYVEKKYIHYIGNPIDFDGISPIKRSVRQLKLIYVGRINNVEKRLDVLFKGLQNLKGDWLLNIIGDGPDRISLQKYAIDLGIDERIQWMGWSEKPWNQLSAASALVLSSDYEGFGLVVVEALARGLPVISTACGGPNETIKEGVNGWLFPCQDSLCLHNILQDILDGNKTLPDEDVCRKSVDKYHVSKVVDQIELAIKETLLKRELNK
ncbi:glycosyltransferase [Terrilactibacillus sp. S3-3]|nr:glycosyltransferase [Terrilactibacillus sp. S3-3]